MDRHQSKRAIKNPKKTLQKYRIKPLDKLQSPEVVLEMFSNVKKKFITLGTLGNFGLVIGKGKSKKSFLIGLIIAVILSRNKKLFSQFQNRLPKRKKKNIVF